MSTIIKRIVVVTMTAAIAIAIVGCSAGPGTTSLISGLPESTAATQTSTPVPFAIPGDTDGNGKLSTWEQEQVAKSIYTMPDGSEVSIPADQPLPPEVLALVTEAVRPLAEQIATGNGEGLARANDALYAAIQTEEAKIHRRIIPITYTRVKSDGSHGWAVGSPAEIREGGFETLDEAKIYADAWVNGQPQYVVIAFD
jgi:hypothetical protein